MTSDEIKKALECCSEHEGCHNCHCKKECGDLSVVTTEALNYINKLESQVESIQQQVYAVYADLSKIIKTQKTEIDGLNNKLIEQQLKNNMLYETSLEIKSEAIKEFAKKFQTRMQDLARIDNNGLPLFLVSEKFIDDFVKEMVGD